MPIEDELKEHLSAILREKALKEGWTKERFEFTLNLLYGLMGALKESSKEGVKGYIAGKIAEIEAWP